MCNMSRKSKFVTTPFKYLVYDFDGRRRGKKASIDNFCTNGNLSTIH